MFYQLNYAARYKAWVGFEPTRYRICPKGTSFASQSGALNHLVNHAIRRRQDLNLHTLSGWRFSGPLLHQLSDYGIKKAAASIQETTAKTAQTFCFT